MYRLQIISKENRLVLRKTKSSVKILKKTQKKVNIQAKVKRGLKGDTGPQGIPGPQGEQGPKGNPGDPATNLVQSVNGKQGVVVLNSVDVGADAAGAAAQALSDAKDYTDIAVSNIDTGVVSVQAGANVSVDNTDPKNPIVSSTGGGGVSEWGDIGGTLSDQTDLQNALNAKQATLVSGTNIKTINGTDLLGSGNITISGGGGDGIMQGTGFPNGVVTAPVGSIYVDTNTTSGASSWVKKTGTGNTGWEVLEGDTGWRVFALNPAPWNRTVSVRIRRIGTTVYMEPHAPSSNGVWRLGSIDASEVSYTVVAFRLNIGFRPANRVVAQILSGRDTEDGQQMGRILIDGTDGAVRVRHPAHTALAMTATWPTAEPWPTTLPGSGV